MICKRPSFFIVRVPLLSFNAWVNHNLDSVIVEVSLPFHDGLSLPGAKLSASYEEFFRASFCPTFHDEL